MGYHTDENAVKFAEDAKKFYDEHAEEIRAFAKKLGLKAFTILPHAVELYGPGSKEWTGD